MIIRLHKTEAKVKIKVRISKRLKGRAIKVHQIQADKIIESNGLGIRINNKSQSNSKLQGMNQLTPVIKLDKRSKLNYLKSYLKNKQKK